MGCMSRICCSSQAALREEGVVLLPADLRDHGWAFKVSLGWVCGWPKDTHLHQRREEIALCEVRKQTGLECSWSHAQSHLNSFHLYTNCTWSWSDRHIYSYVLLDIPVLPELMFVSSVATRSLNTVSTLSRPANTSIMSELGFVYFFESTLVRNTVKF